MTKMDDFLRNVRTTIYHHMIGLSLTFSPVFWGLFLRKPPFICTGSFFRNKLGSFIRKRSSTRKQNLLGWFPDKWPRFWLMFAGLFLKNTTFWPLSHWKQTMFGCFCHCSAKIAPKSLILNDCSNVRAFLHRVWVKRRCVGRVGLPMHEIKTPKIFNLLSIYSNNNKYIQNPTHFFLCFRPLACSQLCSTSPYAETKHP